MMNKIAAGVIAGLVATIVLSMLMVMKNMMGIMPDVDIIAMLAMKMGGVAAMGWMIHFYDWCNRLRLSFCPDF